MIQRTEHDDNYSVIANDTIRNPDLSDSAKVLLLFMLSCSDDWNFNVKGLASALGWSERKIMRLIPELKKAGYLEQKLHSDSKGRFLPPDWVVYEVPTAIHENRNAVEPQRGQTATRSDRNTAEPQCGKSVVIRNTNIKEIPNSKEISKEKKDIFRKPTFEEVSTYCLERNNGIDPEQFIDYYESKGWVVGKSKMKDWKACVRTWERNRKGKPTAIKNPNPVSEESPFKKLLREEGYSI